jgi:putative NADH-flavin reductase
VVAVVRRPGAMHGTGPGVTVRAADVLDPAAVHEALADCDAVVAAVGSGSGRTSTTVYSHGVSNLVDGMRHHGVRRLSVVSAVPVAPRGDAPLVERALAMPLLDRFFGAAYDDMRRMETLLGDVADLDWVCLRPPRLLDRPATGTYRLDVARLPRSRSITHADLAAAMLAVLDRPDLWRHTVFVTN